MLLVANSDVHPLAGSGTRNFMRVILWASVTLAETVLTGTCVPTPLVQDTSFLLEIKLSESIWAV